MENNIESILVKAKQLNERASQLNKDNQSKRVEKEYARKDLERSLVELKKLIPDLNLDVDNENFEDELGKLKQEITQRVITESEHLEKILTAQETGNIAELEKLMGIHIGNTTVSQEVKLEELQEEKAETLSYGTDSVLTAETPVSDSETSTPEQPKEESAQSETVPTGLFGGIENSGTETVAETSTETTVTDEEPTDIQGVKDLFNGLTSGGIASTETVVKTETEEPKSETDGTVPTGFGAFFGN